MSSQYLNDDLKDKDLIKEYRKGKVNSFNLLFIKYQYHLKKLASSYFNTHKCSYLTKDDFYSVCLESFFFGAKTYDVDSDYSFYSYFKKISEHEVGKMLKAHSLFYNHLAFSMDEKLFFDDGLTFGEMIPYNDNKINNLDSSSLVMRICEDDSIELKDEEKMALSLRIFGESFISIAQRLDCDTKRARAIFYNAIRKIRKHKIQLEMFK